MSTYHATVVAAGVSASVGIFLFSTFTRQSVAFKKDLHRKFADVLCCPAIIRLLVNLCECFDLVFKR